MASTVLLEVRVRQLYAFMLVLDQVQSFKLRGARPRPTGMLVALLLMTIHALRALPWDLVPLVFHRARGELGLLTSALKPREVLRGDWARLVKSVVIHADLVHVTYCVCRFLDLAARMEDVFGTVPFAVLVVYLSTVANAIYVAVAVVMASIFNQYQFYFNGSVVGFSGAVFALMAVSSGYPGIEFGDEIFFGVVIPPRWRLWKELFICKSLVPKSSMLGNVCGIVAGATVLLLRIVVPSGVRRRLHID